MNDKKLLQFPPGFIWGSASSAYQIEGAWNEAGKGPSIWDTFTHKDGFINRNENGDVAADHYHRWGEDLQLMSSLGLQAYRFSISWPRVLPDGVGRINQAGWDFYDRLVDGLLEKNIQPLVTLYHWDLPQTLQDKGGWASRTIIDAFADYAGLAGKRLGDRVSSWITHNEPMVSAYLGHYLGINAPGLTDPKAAIVTGINMLLSHSEAVKALRAACPLASKIGITLNLSPVHPASNSTEDNEAARLFELVSNRFFLDPVLLGSLPEELLSLAGMLGIEIDPEDIRRICVPLEFMGINYYSRSVVRFRPDAPVLPIDLMTPAGNEYSQMWEIYPQGIFEILKLIQTEYLPRTFPGLRLMISENGIPVPDGLDFDRRIRDERRIRYIHHHLAQLHRAIQEGVPLDGYFVWALLDNFEWAYGYSMRYGLVHVDFHTQERIVKDSGHWYADVIRRNAILAP